jgi:hypothetical protein
LDRFFLKATIFFLKVENKRSRGNVKCQYFTAELSIEIRPADLTGLCYTGSRDKNICRCPQR